MKTIFFFGAALLASATAQAQNSAVINQQGGQSTSVIQNGNGTTSVVSQSTGGNTATVSQSGSGNTATINQGNVILTDEQAKEAAGQSVGVSQSGGGDTVISQTNGSNSIYIRQGSDPATAPSEKPKKRAKRKNP